ncbi:MAG: transporter substrate-binding domain-containing protein [Thalassotalea sp.]|nr:transporter substrate-binding domain-containing protein [Thalassotalea sp.]
MSFFSFILLMLFPYVINANEYTLENIDSKYHLSVVTENWYPFNYLDKNGELTGSSTELVKSILEHANIPYEINVYPWQRSYSLARTQKNTLIYSIFRSPIREEMFHWVCPISTKAIHSVYKLSKRVDIKINSKNDLAEYSINVTRGTFPHEFFLGKGMEEGVNLQLTATNEANLLMLIKNRVDLIVEVEIGVFQMLRELGLPENTIEKAYTFEEMNQAQSCLAVSKGTPQHIIEKIKQSHKALYLD